MDDQTVTPLFLESYGEHSAIPGAKKTAMLECVVKWGEAKNLPELLIGRWFHQGLFGEVAVVGNFIVSKCTVERGLFWNTTCRIEITAMKSAAVDHPIRSGIFEWYTPGIVAHLCNLPLRLSSGA